jgi:hypothetical protein
MRFVRLTANEFSGRSSKLFGNCRIENSGGTMQHRVLRSFQYFCLLGLVLCLTLEAQASNAHKFSALYQILKVTAQDDDNVQVELSLRVINYSGANVTDATISLVSSLVTGGPEFEWEKEQVPFTNVTLPFNPHAKKLAPALVGTFTIPADEYAQWKKGAGPRFVIAYQDPAGEQQSVRIDTAPAP